MLLLTFWPDGIPSGSPPRLHRHQCAPIFILLYPTDAMDEGISTGEPTLRGPD